jgi:hypothetical protein
MNTPGTIVSPHIARAIPSTSDHPMKLLNLNSVRRTGGPVNRLDARTSGLGIGFTVLIERVAGWLRPPRLA